jgi:hypothetical protein
VAALYTDNFNRADETPLNATTWPLTGTGSFNLATNQVSHPNDANDNEVYYSAASALGDQYCQVKFTKAPGDASEQGVGVVCRHIASGATRTFIRAVVDNSGAITVRAFAAGTGTLIGSNAGTFTTGDVLRMEVTGTSPNIVVKVFKNGVQVGVNFTGVTGPNTGKPGMCFSSSTSNTMTLDDWEAGDFSVGGAPHPFEPIPFISPRRM